MEAAVLKWRALPPDDRCSDELGLQLGLGEQRLEFLVAILVDLCH